MRNGWTNSRHPAEHGCDGEAVSRREIHTHEDHARREVGAHQHRNENGHDFWRYRKSYTKSTGVTCKQGRGCIHNLAYHSYMNIDLASLQSQDGARRVFVGPGSRRNMAYVLYHVKDFAGCLSCRSDNDQDTDCMGGLFRFFAINEILAVRVPGLPPHARNCFAKRSRTSSS